MHGAHPDQSAALTGTEHVAVAIWWTDTTCKTVLSLDYSSHNTLTPAVFGDLQKDCLHRQHSFIHSLSFQRADL